MLFDLTGVETKKPDFGLLPDGEYVVTCDDAQVKETKDGTGEYINVKLGICQGDYKGRVLFVMFNIKNKNPKAVEIGFQQLKTFMVSADAPSLAVKSVSELLGLTCIAVVKTKTDEKFGDKNVVSYFKKITDAKIKVAAKEEPPF